MAPRGNADIDRLGFTKWPPFVTFFWPSKTANETWLGAVEAFHKFHNEGRVGHDQHLPYWNKECVQCSKCFPKQHWNVLKQRLMECENLWRLWLKPHDVDLSRDWAFFSLMTVSWTADWDLPVASWQKLLCISFILHGVVHDQACWSWWKKKPQINSCQENVISVAIPISKGFLHSLQTEMCE